MKLKQKLIAILFVTGILGSLAVGILSPIFRGNASAYTKADDNAAVVRGMQSCAQKGRKPFTIGEAFTGVQNLKEGTTLKDAGLTDKDNVNLSSSDADGLKETVYSYFVHQDWLDYSTNQNEHPEEMQPCDTAKRVVDYGISLGRSAAADTTILQKSLADQKKNYKAADFDAALTDCPKTSLAAANEVQTGFSEKNYETLLSKCLKTKLKNLPAASLTAAMAAIADPSSLQGTGCLDSEVDAGGNCEAQNCTGTILADGTCQAASSDNSNSGDNSDQPSCESTAGGLGWIICKLIDGLQNAVGYMYDSIIKPLLVTEPLSTSSTSGSQVYKAWSNFRIYGDVLLVIFLLIIVFGESIGGGVIDAYTAKKVLPRLLVAAILINISFYLVAIMADVADVVGTGLMSLITAPFGLTGDFTLNIGRTGATTMTALLVGAVVWAKISLAGQGIAWLWFSVLLPLILIFLAIMVTVLFRRALIVFLVIISPVAFALYCLPNTEKYFKKWWDTLFETLLVFPIIACLFAMGKVGAYLIDQVGGTNFVQGGIADILAVVALAAPLIVVPFSFKLAGGIVGRAYDLANGARSKVSLGQASRDRIKAQGARNRLQARSKLNATLQSEASKGGRFRRATLGRALKGTGGLMGYNIEAEASAARAEVGKTINDQIATGKDDEIRGLTVNKGWALQQAYGEHYRDKQNDDGSTTRQFKSLGGQWVNEADVDKGHSRWGNDTYAQQAALSYEMRKAQSEGQLQEVAKNYRAVAQGQDAAGNKIAGAGKGWGMDDQEAGGAWIGAAFERQNEHLEYKSTDWKSGDLSRDGNGVLGGGLVDEIYEKKGSYPVAQMGSNTVEQLKTAYRDAETRGDTVTMDKIGAISETFMHDVGRSGQQAAAGDPGQDALFEMQPNAPAGGAGGQRQAGTPGAAHVAERVVELASMTGRYQTPPPGAPQK